jgi:F0F1-type ATP synthase assembly protein I
MKYALVAMLVIGACVGMSLFASAGGRGTGMILFALLAVGFFASLPVLVARNAGEGSGANPRPTEPAQTEERQVVDFGNRDQRSDPRS